MKEPDWEFIRGNYAVCITPNVLLPEGSYASPGDSFLIAGYLDDERSGDRLLVMWRDVMIRAELFTAHWSHFRIMEGGGS